MLGLLAAHPAWGVVALPLLSRLYIRAKDLPAIDPRHRHEFRTKLVLAVELLRWAKKWLGLLGKPLWVVVDGAYAKADFLKPAQALGRRSSADTARNRPCTRSPAPDQRDVVADPGSTANIASTWPSGEASDVVG